jgi:hypothetical protein
MSEKPDSENAVEEPILAEAVEGQRTNTNRKRLITTGVAGSAIGIAVGLVLAGILALPGVPTETLFLRWYMRGRASTKMAAYQLRTRDRHLDHQEVAGVAAVFGAILGAVSGMIAGTYERRHHRIERLWLYASLTAWVVISNIDLLALLAHEFSNDVAPALASPLFPAFAVFAAGWGGLITTFSVTIPSRIALNLIVAERRRKRFGETVMCIVTFLILCWAVYSIVTCPIED